MKSLVKNYFEGSYKNAVSFLVEKNEMSVEDLEMLLNELKNNSDSESPSPLERDLGRGQKD